MQAPYHHRAPAPTVTGAPAHEARDTYPSESSLADVSRETPSLTSSSARSRDPTAGVRTRRAVVLPERLCAPSLSAHSRVTAWHQPPAQSPAAPNAALARLRGDSPQHRTPVTDSAAAARSLRLMGSNVRQLAPIRPTAFSPRFLRNPVARTNVRDTQESEIYSSGTGS